MDLVRVAVWSAAAGAIALIVVANLADFVLARHVAAEAAAPGTARRCGHRGEVMAVEEAPLGPRRPRPRHAWRSVTARMRS